MGTWIKETDQAIYLMDGGYYVAKVDKHPSNTNPREKIAYTTALKTWFSRPDPPRAMTITPQGPEPAPQPVQMADQTTTTPSRPGERHINADGLNMVKSFEGLRLQAYQDAVKVWTIGYGTTQGVKPGMSITKDEAEQLLKRDLLKFENAVKSMVQVPINDNQFSALVCFTYNVGAGALKSSTLLRKLNARDYAGAADEFTRWNKAGGRVLAGLTRRRNAERALFLGQNYRKYLA